MKTSKQYTETNEIYFTTQAPGYIYLLAENVHGVSKLKIGLNLHGTVELSIITEDAWNPYLKRYEIAVGDGLELECQSISFYDIKWSLNNTDLPDTTNYILGELYKSEHIKTQKMMIANVAKKDEGQYSCFDPKYNSNAFKIENQQVKVVAKTKPVISSNLSKDLVVRNFGDSIELYCTVEEISVRNFSWYKNGQLLNDDNKNSTELQFSRYKISMKIKNLTRNDAGKYSCVAMNNFGDNKHFTSITFQGKFVKENLN